VYVGIVRPRSLPRALAVLALAARVAQADVVTQFDGSRLLIAGDAQADTVTLDPTPGGVLVTGSNGTLVDGGLAPVFFSGVRRVAFELHGGPDRVTVNAVDLPDGIGMRLGDGDDEAVVSGAFLGQTKIRTGNGNDAVWAFDMRAQRFYVQTNQGWDAVVVHGSWVPGDLQVSTGSDEDYVEIAGTEVGNDARMRLGNDDDDLFLADIAFDDDTRLDGDHGDNGLFFAGYIWFGDELDIHDFGDDWWW
jgi:hypothetical protein